MDFRTTLKHLGRLGEVNFEEFAEATGIPRHNASVYLSRLFKMGLVSRRKDKRYGKDYPRTPYRYQVSKKGDQYLKYLLRDASIVSSHYDDDHFKASKILDRVGGYNKMKDIEKELVEPEKKIPYVVDGVMLHLTPAEFLEWKKFEGEQRITKREREERKQDKYK